MPRGVEVEELQIGDGPEVTRGAIVTVRFDGTLRRAERLGGDTKTYQDAGTGRRLGPALLIYWYSLPEKRHWP